MYLNAVLERLRALRLRRISKGDVPVSGLQEWTELASLTNLRAVWTCMTCLEGFRAGRYRLRVRMSSLPTHRDRTRPTIDSLPDAVEA